jgi:tetratricopeptide (TPR) repeat protein
VIEAASRLLPKQAITEMARAALSGGDPDGAEQRLASWLQHNGADPLVLHYQALLLRVLDRRGDAITALNTALRISPRDPRLTHALAHVTLEAGLPASAVFQQALALAPDNEEAYLGLASARFAESQGVKGLAELDATILRNPLWLAGHRTRVQLATMLGQADRAFSVLNGALERQPKATALRQLRIDLQIEGEAFADALQSCEGADQSPAVMLAKATAQDELDLPQAAASFAALGKPGSAPHAVRLIRHLLRIGAPELAKSELEPWLGKPGSEAFWPYATLIWRLLNDPRADWLERQPGLVQIVDLADDQTGRTGLLETLRALHARSGRFLDQSVRLGTQTDGPLFARIDPEIVALRAGIVTAIEDYRAKLPAADSNHPLLSVPRDRAVRFAGSWSVRLTDQGHHTSHHHPQGWISSAFYVTLPDGLSGEEGHLVLGEAPPELRLGLPPIRVVAPKPGRLVLFPSYMWHATRPFGAGERVTVAFDVARP